MEKEQLHKKLDDFLAGSNKEKVDKELFSLLVRMDECRKVASPPQPLRQNSSGPSLYSSAALSAVYSIRPE